MAAILHVNREGLRGASSLTPTQLRDYAIDSQVLFVKGFNQRRRGSLANGHSFDIIRAIQFAALKKTSLA
jgi:hypothetical protein